MDDSSSMQSGPYSFFVCTVRRAMLARCTGYASFRNCELMCVHPRAVKCRRVSYKLWALWPLSLYCSDELYIADRSSGPWKDLCVPA